MSDIPSEAIGLVLLLFSLLLACVIYKFFGYRRRKKGKPGVPLVIKTVRREKK